MEKKNKFPVVSYSQLSVSKENGGEKNMLWRFKTFFLDRMHYCAVPTDDVYTHFPPQPG